MSRVSLIKSKFFNIYANITEISNSIELPQRFKGTIVEKWAKYWKMLGIDYKEVAVDLIKDIKQKPIKASIYGTFLTSAYICAKRNPTEEDFMYQYRMANSDMLMVHQSVHKIEAAEHLKSIERYLNYGILRYLNLGILSFMWIDDYSENVALYKAICPHLQIQYLQFHKRIVDIGFWNQWWKLKDKMIDYDVNL